MKRPKKKKQSAQESVGPVRKTGRAIYYLISLVIAAVGYAATVYVERPKVSITPQSTTIDAADAFKVPFDVTNTGDVLAMEDIRAGCDGNAVYTARSFGIVTPKVYIGVDSFSKLGPGKSFTTACIFALDVGGIPVEVSEITITMKAKYSVFMWPSRLSYQRSFRFAKAPDGQFHWMGNG